MKKILVIDDKEDNLTTISAVIKSNLPELQIMTAQSGKEGLRIAKKVYRYHTDIPGNKNAE